MTPLVSVGKSTGGLLRELRHREGPFEIGQIQEAVTAAQARGDKVPRVSGFECDGKKDVLYRLLMPKLDDVLSKELAQAGD